MLQMITVSVGKTGTRFPVHESIIRKSSKFFDNALKPEWATSRPDPHVIDLSDEALDTFSVYVHWLYFKNIPSVFNKDERGFTEQILLCKCYVMGSKLMDTAFRNAVLKALLGASQNQPCVGKHVPGQASVNILYKGSMEDSPARKLIVDLWVCYAGEAWMKALTTDLSHEFVLDFARALLLERCKAANDIRPWKERIKDYLEKED